MTSFDIDTVSLTTVLVDVGVNKVDQVRADRRLEHVWQRSGAKHGRSIFGKDANNLASGGLADVNNCE